MSNRRMAPWLLPAIGAVVLAGGALLAALSSPLRRGASDGVEPAPPLLSALPSETSSPNVEASAVNAAVSREEPSDDEMSFGSAIDGAFESGPRIVEGTVRHLDGRPLSGVLIRATPNFWMDFPFLDGTGEPSLSRGAPPPAGSELDQIERMQSHVRSRVRECRTDVAGCYRLELPDHAPSRVQAFLEGFDLQSPSHGEMAELHSEGTVDFLAHPLIEVRIDVRLPDGSNPRQAMVTAHAGRANWRTIPWSPRNARTWLPEGSWIFSADRRGWQFPNSASEVAIDVSASAPPSEPIVLQVVTGARVQGRLSWPQAELLGPSALNVFATNAPDELVETMSGASDNRVVFGDGANMRYRLDDVPCGPRVIRVQFGPRLLCERSIEVLAPVTSCDLEVAPLPDLRVASCRVLDPEGKPALDAIIEVLERSSASSDDFTRILRRSSDRWIVAFLAPSGPRELSLQASATRFGTKSMKCSLEGSDEVEIRFEEPGSLYVEARAATPHRVRCTLTPREGTHEPSRSPFHEDDRFFAAPGRTSWSRLQPGAYKLSFWKHDEDGGYRLDKTCLEREVELHQGRNEIAVDL